MVLPWLKKTTTRNNPTVLSFRIGRSTRRDFKKSLRVEASPGTRIMVACITSVTQKPFEGSVCSHSSIRVKITSPVHTCINLRLVFVEQSAIRASQGDSTTQFI